MPVSDEVKRSLILSLKTGGQIAEEVV
jgi:hypothetical protein